MKSHFFKKITLIFCIIFTFTDITNLPIPYKYIFEALFLFCIFIYGGILLSCQYFSGRMFEKNTLIVDYLIIISILVTTSVLLTKINFGQPIIYGILSERRSLYALLGVIIYWLLKNKRLTINELENIFVVSFILVLIFYIIMNILIPPSVMYKADINDISHQFASFNEQRGIFRYRFDMSLIVFGLIYSMFAQKTNLIMKLFFISSIFYIFIIFRGRIIIITSLIIFLYYLVFHAKVNTKINFFIYIPIIFCLILLGNDYFSFDISNFLNFFKEALSASVGNIGSDVSANSRVAQSKIAFKFLSQFYYFGVGVTSQQWEKSPEHLFGYFHTRDLGIIGLWFHYSILSVLSYLYIAVKVTFLYCKVKERNFFIKTCYLYSIYLVIVTFGTGWIFESSTIGEFSIVLSILAFDIKQNMDNIQVKESVLLGT